MARSLAAPVGLSGGRGAGAAIPHCTTRVQQIQAWPRPSRSTDAWEIALASHSSTFGSEAVRRPPRRPTSAGGSDTARTRSPMKRRGFLKDTVLTAAALPLARGLVSPHVRAAEEQTKGAE